MLDDFITERKIEDRYNKTEKDIDGSERNGDNVHLKDDQHSHGEQSVTDDSNDVTMNCDQEIK